MRSPWILFKGKPSLSFVIHVPSNVYNSGTCAFHWTFYFMKAGGNDAAREFFKSHDDYNENWTLQEKYGSKTAALLRDKVNGLVLGTQHVIRVCGKHALCKPWC